MVEIGRRAAIPGLVSIVLSGIPIQAAAAPLTCIPTPIQPCPIGQPPGPLPPSFQPPVAPPASPPAPVTTQPPAVTVTPDYGIGALQRWVSSSAAWVFKLLPDALTKPAAMDWFTPLFQKMVRIAVLLLLPFLFLAFGRALRFRDPSIALKALFGYAPLAVAMTAVVLGVTQQLITLGDDLTDYLLPSSDFAVMMAAWGALAAATFAGGAAAAFGGQPELAFVAFGACLSIVVLGLGLVLELLLRTIVIYACLLFLPLFFAAMVWPPALRAVKILTTATVAAIASKFVIAAVLSMGMAAARAGVFGLGPYHVVTGPEQLPGDSGVWTLAFAAGVILIAFAAPFTFLKLIPGVMDATIHHVQGHRDLASAPLRSAGTSGSRWMVQRVRQGHSSAGGTLPILGTEFAVVSHGGRLVVERTRQRSRDWQELMSGSPAQRSTRTPTRPATPTARRLDSPSKPAPPPEISDPES